MNTSAKFLMGLLVFILILLFWESERFLAATLTGLATFILLIQVKGND
jgi:uncharacterized membrane protein YqjE